VAAGRHRPGWGLRLGLGLLLVVAALVVPRPAPATARPYEAAARTYAGSVAGPLVTDSDRHGIDKRDGAPPAAERRVARGVGGVARHMSQDLRPHLVLRTRLATSIPAAPPSRAEGGHSPRAPPQAPATTQPLA
jgi:hypothetical protein